MIVAFHEDSTGNQEVILCVRRAILQGRGCAELEGARWKLEIAVTKKLAQVAVSHSKDCRMHYI